MKLTLTLISPWEIHNLHLKKLVGSDTTYEVLCAQILEEIFCIVISLSCLAWSVSHFSSFVITSSY